MAIIPAEEKVFMVSNSTNTTYSGSAALKAMQQWYTMEDVTNTVRPYQVFTALLTQSGGDGASTTFGYNNIYKGTTYTIVSLEPGEDVMPYGAPNNDVGTSFICNQDVFTSWGFSSSEMSYNTGAPVATVLENTIGNIWFTYIVEGIYNISSGDLFTDNKTWCSATLSNWDYDATNVVLGQINGNTVQMITLVAGDDRYDGSDTSIEIRVYN